MIFNYVKLAFRNMMKHKFFSAINILGMSIGVSACLLILLYVVDELSYDRFHPDASRMLQVGLHAKVGDQDVLVANTPPPMASALVDEIPGVTDATRISHFWGAPSLRVGEQAFTEDKIFHADSNFFDFFGYQLLHGDARSALSDPNTVVLTENIAKKYFGDKDPIGELITIGGYQTFKVSGVAANAPTNSHFRFNVLLSAASAPQMQRTEWLNNFLFTYLKVDENTSATDIESKFPDLVEKYVGPEVERVMGASLKQMRSNGGAYGFFITPVSDLHLRAKTRDGLEPHGNIMYVYFFAGIGGFIILIACINFMNLSTARSASRAKEVGLRKTLGSLRSQMVKQFLAESTVYSTLALLLALLICYLALPEFNSLSQKQLDMSVFLQPFFITAMVLLVLIVGLLAGSYPAFYLTSFGVVEVLKGKVRAGMKSKGIRSSLVVVQFSLSIFLITFTAVVFKQISFMQNRNLGIDKQNVLVIPNAGHLENDRAAFRNTLLQQPGFLNASFSNNRFPGVNNTTVFKAIGSDQDRIMGTYEADYDHQDVIKFELKEGRYFSRDFPSDSTAIIINEAAVKDFGFDHPLQEQVILLDGNTEKKFTVIGVMKDFNFESLKAEIRPLSIRLTDVSFQLAVRFTGNPSDVVASIEKLWKQHVPGQPFDYRFMDEEYDELFRSEQRLGKLFTVFSVLAIFIACLGLFALAAFMAEQRTKEIGIRKVMGASTAGLSMMLSKEFTKLVIISFVPAAICSWLAVDAWLDGFAYRVQIDPWIYVGSGIVATVIAWLTVGFQSVKAAAANPVNSLRCE